MTDNQMLIEQYNDNTLFIIVLVIMAIVCFYRATKKIPMLGKATFVSLGVSLILTSILI